MIEVPKKQSLILPFIIGICLGITAKLVDVPAITYRYPIFDDIMARFGIWVWVAALLAVYSRTPWLAAVRSFVFFTGMLSAYYGYTILFLKFYPKSQILLWSGIAMFTPFCGFLIWQIHKKRVYADFIASLPFMLFFTEWYLTAKDNLLLGMVYFGMALSFSVVIPTGKKRFFGLFYGLLLSVIGIQLVQAGIITNLYELLLNI